jgi:hypothetical protein
MVRLRLLLVFGVNVLASVAPAAAQTPLPADGLNGQITHVAKPTRFVGNALSMDFGEGSLWVSCHSGGPIWRQPEGKTYRIDPRTYETLAAIPVSGCVAVGEGAVWVRHGPEFIGSRALPENQGLLSKIDPRTNQIVATVPVDRWYGVLRIQGNLAAGAGGVWLIDRLRKHIVRLDPRSLQVVASIPLEDEPFNVTLGEGSVWVLTARQIFAAHYNHARLCQLDPKTNRLVASIPVNSSRVKVVVGEGWIWVVEREETFNDSGLVKVTRINPATHRAEGTPIPLGNTEDPVVLLGNGGLWVGQTDPARGKGLKGILSFIDARTGQVSQTPGPFMRGPSAFGAQSLWLTNTWSHGTFLDRVQP